MNNKAQGTIEYLIIIAVIVVIALIVVSLLVTQTENFSKTASTANKISTKMQIIGIEESFQNQEGYYALVLASNFGEKLTIKSIYIDNYFVSLSGTDKLMLDTKKAFILPLVSASCTQGETIKKNVTITYTSESGLDKNISYPEKINFECSNSSVNSNITAGLGGTTQSTANVSAKLIHLTYPSAPDGTYWIDPNGGDTSDAFQAYCDMTNGGWIRILSLIDEGAKTNSLLDRGITFTKFRAVKANDHSIYQEATFSTPQNANLNLTAYATETKTKIMLNGAGAYGVWVWTDSEAFQCAWGSVTMFGSGYEGAPDNCGTDSKIQAGRNLGGTPMLTERFDVDLYVQ